MATDRLPRELLTLIGAVLLGVFLVQMDSTMVTVALESLRRDFAADLGTVQWVSAAYLLAMAGVIPVAGWAVDRFGARTAWLTSLALFLLGSLLCGLAWSAGSLIAMRVVQGIGGGLLMPLFQTILARQVRGRSLGRVMGLVAAPLLLGPVLGPMLGGVLVDGPGWRWIFLVNLPVGAVAAGVAARVLPAGRLDHPVRLDLTGLALLSPALTAIVWSLSQAGADGGFGAATGLVLLTGVALLAWFIGHALRTADPVVDLRLFHSRAFSAASALMFLSMVALLGTMLLIPLYYQQVHGFTPARAGLLLAPNGIGSAVALSLGGRIVDRAGVRPVAVPGAVLLLGVELALTQLSAGTTGWVLIPLIALGGAGFGAVLVAAQSVIFGGLPSAAVPHATTAVRVFQQVGSSIGVTVLAVALQRNAAHATSPAALSAAFGHTYWWAAGAAALLLIPAVLIGRRQPVTVAA
ncbi:DHA2 family efflux MFS transporter permease subunit [Actinoplanes sp. N902-109]|uniref:DHA2 family efflux MFS transporter permease subunit n=1 Tax=Actinoplanes sp. (strain N902-109) TaxID=649831 RepID=UPI0003293E31|nr:DHA2 family efflux MFS transporter permease subunit [Actinoplanes sp. N902-109]AGL15451.1 EmrB/QacA subfamily drug resistance transporter [Actinoplanes sp. N902-109]